MTLTPVQVFSDRMMTTELDSAPTLLQALDRAKWFSTSLFNGIQAELDKPGNIAPLTLAEGLQAAAEHPIWTRQG